MIPYHLLSPATQSVEITFYIVIFLNTVLLQSAPSPFVPFLPPTSILEILQNTKWKQLRIYVKRKLLEFT